MKQLKDLEPEEYYTLKGLGYLHEFYPEATGDWYKDCRDAKIDDAIKSEENTEYLLESYCKECPWTTQEHFPLYLEKGVIVSWDHYNAKLKELKLGVYSDSYPSLAVTKDDAFEIFYPDKEEPLEEGQTWWVNFEWGTPLIKAFIVQKSNSTVTLKTYPVCNSEQTGRYAIEQVNFVEEVK